MNESLIARDQVDDNIDYYNMLVGDNAKFKNEKELAKGKYIADNYILTLESQMDQLRKDYEKERQENMAKAKLSDMLDQWQNRTQAPPETQTTPQDKSPSLDVKQLESLIDTRMQERETSRKQQDNYNYVKNKLVEKFGQNYSNQLSQVMADLDMPEQYLNDMARNNPKALLKMLGAEEVSVTRDPFRAPPRNSLVQNQYTPQQEDHTWSWYQKLKEENPKKYYSRETNVQMHKDALRLGAAFEDGDFNKYEKDYRISY